MDEDLGDNVEYEPLAIALVNAIQMGGVYVEIGHGEPPTLLGRSDKLGSSGD